MSGRVRLNRKPTASHRPGVVQETWARALPLRGAAVTGVACADQRVPSQASISDWLPSDPAAKQWPGAGQVTPNRVALALPAVGWICQVPLDQT